VPGGGHETSSTLPVVLRYCDDTKRPEKYTTQLVGLSTDDAKKKAQAAGFTGKIEVREITDDPQCKIGTVCRVYPDRWELNQDHSMTLYVAKSLSISVPD
jgi:beta-lactam-binding protein with PASTA domain